MDEQADFQYLDELQSKLKEKYPQLTDADIQYPESGEQEMLRMVEYKLRKTKQEMKDIIAGF